MSPAAELTGAPRFTGSDHLELAKDMAWSLGAAGLGSVAHATSSARVTGVASSATDAPLMGLLLMPARRAGRDPDVRAAKTPGPTRGEDQRAAVARAARTSAAHPSRWQVIAIPRIVASVSALPLAPTPCRLSSFPPPP